VLLRAQRSQPVGQAGAGTRPRGRPPLLPLLLPRCLCLGWGARQLLRLRGGEDRLLIAAAASCTHRQGLRGHRCRTLGAMVC
jgi:hypothetical protein